MLTIEKTDIFLNWLKSLRDIRAIARIQIRIDRLALGNAGDVKPVGEGVSELRDTGFILPSGVKFLLCCCVAATSERRMPISQRPRNL
jgi:putative component of toxin-antitoxin plasmid stabilization module